MGAADATWGGVFTGFVEATPLALEWSISRAWAADCEAIKFSCRAHFTGSTGIVHELEVRGLVAHPSGPSTADSTYMQQ